LREEVANMANKKNGQPKEVSIPRSESVTIRISYDASGDFPGLDVREFVTSTKYTGPTKKGLRVPVEHIPAFLAALEQVIPATAKKA
jgi:hypothetical protein